MPNVTPLGNTTFLVTGGRTEDGAAYLYDYLTSLFTETDSMHEPRAFGSAVRLASGDVLVTGGGTTDHTGLDASPYPVTATAEIYELKNKQFRLTRSMRTARDGHTSTLLGDRTVLIVGGEG